MHHILQLIFRDEFLRFLFQHIILDHTMDSNQVDPENDAQEVNAKSGPRSVHGFKWFLAAISLYVAVFVYALDGTIAADIQSSIIEQFNDVGSLTWIGTGFPLGSLCFILPS